MEMIIGMIKIMALNNANTCTLCEYRIILNVLSALFFKKSLFQITLFRNAIRAPNSLDPDHFGGPDLGSKCLQSRRYHNRAKCYKFN